MLTIPIILDTRDSEYFPGRPPAAPIDGCQRLLANFRFPNTTGFSYDDAIIVVTTCSRVRRKPLDGIGIDYDGIGGHIETFSIVFLFPSKIGTRGFTYFSVQILA